MKRYRALLACGCLILAHTGASAQERDGQVLRPGQFRLSGGAEYRHIDARFGGDETRSEDGTFGGPLTPAIFAPLAVTARDLEAFFADTEDVAGPGPDDPAALLAGNLAADIAWNTRYLPFRLAMGLIPRLEIGVQLPIYRNERVPRRLDLEGGNVGLNPDSEGNAALLADFAPGLGAAPLLPLEGSPIAVELQQRVLARTGSTLELPTEPLDGWSLRENFPTALPLNSAVGAWQQGDVEVDARLEVLRSFSASAYPEEATDGLQYRATLTGSVRFATGEVAEDQAGFSSAPAVGFSGVRAGAIGDIFYGDRFWLTIGGEMRQLTGPDDPAMADQDPTSLAPFRPDPERSIDLWATPRLRLTREMSIGGTILLERWSEDIDAGISTAAGSRRSVGASIRYTTLPVTESGRSLLPLEVAVGYTRGIGGTEGFTAPNIAYVQLSVQGRPWGRTDR